MVISNKTLKAKMKELYNLYLERGDSSYNDLYTAIRHLSALGLIRESYFQMVYEYDHELFETEGKGYEPKEPKKFDRDMYRDALN